MGEDKLEKQSWKFTLMIDPSTIGTAQQKKFDPRTRRFFTDSKVAKAMKVISLLASSMAKMSGAYLPDQGSAVCLSLKFHYAVPKSRMKPKKGEKPIVEGDPCFAFWAGDCDNRAKAVIDALTLAKFWPDDRYVTSLNVRKAWTFENPRIDVEVSLDD